jgi:hypothetical protein
MITPAGYVCDSCGLLITKERRGLVHGPEQNGCAQPGEPKQGFVFFPWSQESAKALGHVHDQHECISVQVEKYLITLRWGRIGRLGSSHVIRRGGEFCDIT